MINLVLQLFACFTVYGIEYTDTLVGPAYIAEIPITYTQEEQDFCLKNLTKGYLGSIDGKMDVYDCTNYAANTLESADSGQAYEKLTTDESRVLSQLKLIAGLTYLPEMSSGANPNTGCLWQEFATQYVTEPTNQMGFHIKAQCPKGHDSKAKAQQTIQEFFAQHPARSLMAILQESPAGVAGVELAKLETVEIPLDISECLSNMKNEKYSSFFYCEMNPGKALDYLTSQPGHRIALNSQWWQDATGILPAVTIKFEYSYAAHRYVLYASTTPDERVSDAFAIPLDSIAREAIGSAFAALKNYTVYLPKKNSAPSQYPTKPLNFFKRDLRIDLNKCLRWASRNEDAWRSEAPCREQSSVQKSDAAYIWFQSEPEEKLVLTSKSNTVTISGKAENMDFWDYHRGDSLGQGIAYSIQKKTSRPTNPSLLANLFAEFARRNPVLSYTIVK